MCLLPWNQIHLHKQEAILVSHLEKKNKMDIRIVVE